MKLNYILARLRNQMSFLPTFEFRMDRREEWLPLIPGLGSDRRHRP